MKLERQNNAMTRMAPGATFAAFGAGDVGDRGGPGNAPRGEERGSPAVGGGRREEHENARRHHYSESPSAGAGTCTGDREGPIKAPSAHAAGPSGGTYGGGGASNRRPAPKKKVVDDDEDEFSDADLDDLLAD